MKFQPYIGVDKWGVKEWEGIIYPPRTKGRYYLTHYAANFNSIELNATHYKLYDKDSVQKWNDAVPGKDFKFFPKMYKGITHAESLTDKQALLQEFFTSVSELGEHLGRIIIQLSNSFTTEGLRELKTFLESLPLSNNYFIEFTNASWYKNDEPISVAKDLLPPHNNGIVYKDCRQLINKELTLINKKAYVHFQGVGDTATYILRLDYWLEQIADWTKEGIMAPKSHSYYCILAI